MPGIFGKGGALDKAARKLDKATAVGGHQISHVLNPDSLGHKEAVQTWGEAVGFRDSQATTQTTPPPAAVAIGGDQPTTLNPQLTSQTPASQNTPSSLSTNATELMHAEEEADLEELTLPPSNVPSASIQAPEALDSTNWPRDPSTLARYYLALADEQKTPETMHTMVTWLGPEGKPKFIQTLIPPDLIAPEEIDTTMTGVDAHSSDPSA
ncbi:MAG: hypothetical protein V4485_05250 [Pseudomonadota bacterium]